jgi:hypothetical protein
LPDEAAITIAKNAADTKDAAPGKPAGAKEAK